MLKSLIIGDPVRLPTVYSQYERDQISELTDLVREPLSADEVLADLSILREVDVIFGTWGMPKMDPAVLDAAPNLKAIFYGAGTVKSFATEELFQRKVVVTNAYKANAVPVAEYCVATILFSLKLGWAHVRSLHLNRKWHRETDRIAGAYDANIGLISLGAIGKKTLELLRPYDLNILVYSTSLSEEQAGKLGVRLATLEEIFKESDVVSLHTPSLPSTLKMIKPEHFRMMKANATFINTSRGAVVDQSGMVDVLRERTDLTAILDVTEPEPPEPGDPVFGLPNIFVTPHIAGSIGSECRRLGQTAIDECKRYLDNEPLQSPIQLEDLFRMA
jgi:phosphoglycerate dehydrogenase-like enzyme